MGVQRLRAIEPTDQTMWSWLQKERKDVEFLPKAFRNIGKVVTLNTHRVEQAKKHREFMAKKGLLTWSGAQFARNLMYSLALTETKGNLQQAAKLLNVSPGAISDVRLAMQLGVEFHDKPNEKFEQVDIAAMTPMPEYRYHGGPQNDFHRYTKFYPEMVQRVRHLFGEKLTDTAVFLLIDLTHRSKRDDALNWAFHIFTEPRTWIEKTGLPRATFYRAFNQLRRAGFLFRNKNNHWVIAFRGPNFKWLAQQGFIFEDSLGAARVPGVPARLRRLAEEAYEDLKEAVDYRPITLQTRLHDYFCYVFSSLRRFVRAVRTTTVKVFRATKRLRDYVGLGKDRWERGTPRAGPDPGAQAATTIVASV